MIDLDQARFEPTKTIGIVLPESLAAAVEQRAKSELIGKSTWMRRVVLAALNQSEKAA